MVQYRSGTFTSPGTAAAQTITLGFRPSSFKLINYTGYATNTVVSQALWFYGMADAYALIQTVNGSAIPVQSILTSGGFTYTASGALYTSTQYTITGISKANPGVITVSSGTGLVDGQIGTISGVVGMTQVNNIRVVVTNVNTGAGTFDMYDLFGNKIDTSGYTTYSSGGTFNLIADNAAGQVFPDLQYDTGSAYMTLGTGLFRNNADVFYWEAFAENPAGY